MTEIVDGADSQQAALSLMPLIGSEDTVSVNQGTYLSYRFSGFTMRESCKLSSTTEHTVRDWRRQNAEFQQMEHEVAGPRRAEIRKEIAHLLWFRNFVLILRQDGEILMKAAGLGKILEDGMPEALTREELAYLVRARSQYSAQQLTSIEQILSGAIQSGNFDINTFIMNLGNAPIQVNNA